MTGAPLADHLLAPAAAQIERAWHLSTVLVRLGRPVSPIELASRCFLALSPDHVEFLCRIPESPLLLTDGGFVTFSGTAVATFLEFLSLSVSPFSPRVAVRAFAQMRPCGNVFMMYTRKKARVLEDDLFVDFPSAKRRLILSTEVLKETEGNDNKLDQLLIANCAKSAIKEELHIDLMFPPGIPNYLSVSSIACGNPLMIANQKYNLPVKIDSEMDANDEKFDEVQSTGLNVVLSNIQSYHCDAEIRSSVLSRIISKGIDVNEPRKELDFQDPTNNRPGHLKNEMETLTERNPQTPFLPNKIKLHLTNNKISDDDIIGQALGTAVDTETTRTFCCRSGIDTDGIHPTRENLEEFAFKEQTLGMLKPSVPCLLSSLETVHNDQSKAVMNPHTIETSGLCMGLNSFALPIDHHSNYSSHEKNQENKDPKYSVMEKNMKNIFNSNIVIKEDDEALVKKVSKSHLDPKPQPDLESFIIEEEEGSGGYGTVYRARRKTDGKTFAVKCPHANAHSHHVNNEMKMLERFGGKNFVIKYEGSFKSDSSECFVLEHIEHDRPEVLKKEITVFEVQWYGYCMFRALVSLHKQGVVHRDIKPGNFLFSRRLNKGYLIDFNLANDLHQKFSKIRQNDIDRNMKSNPVILTNMKSNPVTLSTMNPASTKQGKRIMKDGLVDPVSKEAAKDLKRHLSKNSRKRSERNPLDNFTKTDKRNKYGTQAADASGVTSAKDPTSTKSPVEKLMQPVPYKGRKELLHFLHEAMQTSNQKGATVPASQRKRVAAPLGKVDRRLVTLTPMPLHYGGNSGADMLNNKRNEKHKREGPCVGTKGFRAPEVLFKSVHQGCKLDIWSAGVTLLYLMIGKTPFSGDPEQNIKDIAKLKGSECLWEVAKLHNREPSFPQDLYDARSLPSLELREWCRLNTRRPEFFEAIPQSLFDLVDKCLAVNPRCRITAEEALMHEFFASCNESLRKQRMLRRESALKSGTNELVETNHLFPICQNQNSEM